jgi:hypothetical protein
MRSEASRREAMDDAMVSAYSLPTRSCARLPIAKGDNRAAARFSFHYP